MKMQHLSVKCLKVLEIQLLQKIYVNDDKIPIEIFGIHIQIHAVPKRNLIRINVVECECIMYLIELVAIDKTQPDSLNVRPSCE